MKDMNIVKIPIAESKENILKRLAEYINNKDVIISDNVVSKLFAGSSMEYEGERNLLHYTA